MSKDLLRIVISTDNHLGVHEKDAIRGKDSFTTFGEVLEFAQEMEADMVLLGGDLFHEVDPTPNTVVQAQSILSKHCLNRRSSDLRILSDQGLNFAEGKVNFDNPKFNVGLPVFSIHGNHDRPHGETALSAMEIPSAAGLINYFGKTEIDENGTLEISPVLIEKGRTRLALFGLGHIADQRLGRVFRTNNAVKWTCPSTLSEYPADSWFNLLVLHQNRVRRGLNSQAYIEDQHLASMENLDFVLWGHEHDCIAEPTPSSTGDFEILQPGSTVATSLAEGESFDKHTFVLEVIRDENGAIQHRTLKQRLETVRPFVFESVTLSDYHGISIDDDNTVKAFLQKKIESMVAKSNRLGSNRLPLIRLKVDYTGFDTIKSHEIQTPFKDKVANWDEILVCTKQAKKKQAKGPVKFAANVAEPCLIDELLSQELHGNLQMFSIESCSALFKSITTLSRKSDVSLFTHKTMERLMPKLMSEESNVTEDAIKAHVKKIISEEEAERNQEEQRIFWNDLFGEQEAENQPKRQQNRRQREESSMESSEEEEDKANTTRRQPEPEQTTTLTKALRSRKGNYRKQQKKKK